MKLFNGLFLLLAAQALLCTTLPAAILLWTLSAQFQTYLAAHHLAIGAADERSPETMFMEGRVILIAAAFVVQLIVLLIAAWVIARRWSAPQRRLYEASCALAEGNFGAEFEEAGPRETIITMRNLRRIAQRFDRLETARRTWLVAIAEELRKPVAAIDAELAATRAASGTVSEDSIDNVGRLIDIARDLEAVALADLGRLPVTFATVDPCALIHNAIWMNKRKAERAGVSLESGNLPATTVIVKWDGARIEQLFTALIENSLRYTPPGGRIVLGLEGSKNAWRLNVDDSAPGVDVDLAQRLFEPFYRTTTSPGESVTSSGLGLATAQAIVEAHHGRIQAGTSPIGGLRVTVVLPASPPTA
ncbi:MAG: hypothetical protein B7Y45_05955 [Sphingomonas sp. 28-66-16]|nr:MAG: hypothetical protein B7Y45_05955 [Sphingomonas sp. 28-66-16]